MTLFIVLLALAIEHFAGIAESVRNLDWFSRYVQALENRCINYPFWQGPAGVIITLAGPLLVVAILMAVFIKYFYPLALVVSLLCLWYSLRHKGLNTRLDNYVTALETSDATRIQQLDSELFMGEEGEGESDRGVLEGVLMQAHQCLFGVLFWFIVLGPFGAILYRLTVALLQVYRDIHGGYSDSVHDLHDILDWPVSRLFALGNALAGNMVDALQAWREVEDGTLAANDNVIRASGMGALSYRQSDTTAEPLLEDRIYWIHALRGLLTRTLLVWLTVLGLMTLSGWMG